MRVKEEVRQCVVFICVPTTLLDGKSGISFIGTAFIVGIPSRSQKGQSYTYLVTAKHVAEKLANKPFLIRINNKKGSCGYVKGDGATWFYHPTDDSIDVAVIPYAPPQ